MLFKLADWVKSNKIHEYLLEHETNYDAQLGSYKFHTISNHMSWCFFTTIVNCLVNEAYLRYCFLKMNPTRIFDKCIRLKVLGDDHVVCVKEGVEFSGRQIKTEMVKIVQHYTSDDKSEDPGDYRSFDQITFLGAHPVKRRGIYTGAIKKSTLYQAKQWTRDDDKSTAITATTMMELSSQWGPEYYENYCSDVVNAFENSGSSITKPGNWREVSRSVGARTTGDFPLVSEGVTHETLTTLHTDLPLKADGIKAINNGSCAMNQPEMNLAYGLNGNVYRESVEWTTTDAFGAEIKSWDIPFGILDKGDDNNLQNMPFDRFIYWNGTVELTLQVTGTPFQQGLAIFYFYPLANGHNIDLENTPSCHHLFITPEMSTTRTLVIPFRYPRSYMNTYTCGDVQESLGTVTLRVF